MTQGFYIVHMAVFAPAILSVGAIVLVVRESWWFLCALPFIWLGSVCAQPNLNLADGCFAYVAMIAGFGVMLLFKPLGLAIMVGAYCGYYASVVEKRIRMRSIPEA